MVAILRHWLEASTKYPFCHNAEFCVKAKRTGFIMASVGESIRSLRKHLGETTTAFGRRLRVDNATISRYERNKLSPSTRVLLKLYAMADKQGCPVEKEAFQRELCHAVDLGFMGGPKEWTPAQIVNSLVSHADEFSRSDEMMDLLGTKRHNWGFRQLVVAVSHAMEVCDIVDDSIAEMLQLWAANSQNPEAPRYFRDALGFLRAKLWRRSETVVGDADGEAPKG